ncbi:MAG: ATP-binding protein [Gammaproteobacteria bacterium]|nr:MAG: ATP-binding protein [Gammaproteobacteria bacterium]
MVNRAYWQELIESAWKHRSIVWLAGVRRVGKTRLCQSLPNIDYFDCELPRVRQQLEDIESFFDTKQKKRIILDEVHRLNNPSEILKIAADHYPSIKVLATGSSTLGASSKFADTLTGRKTDLWLTPMINAEINLFGDTNLKHRLLFGGLPPFFMSKSLPEHDYQEWIDSYWAKDIQELFRLERRDSFQKFTELLLAQSGGIFEASKFAIPCEVSRQTITNYLKVLEATFVAHVIKPFNTHRPTEIVSAPKVYGFDSGFVCHAKGWLELRQEDLGLLWEHYVLNEMNARLQTRKIHYWRDKQKHEIDFILQKKRSKSLIAIECKWLANQFDPDNMKIFREKYPQGENYVVASNISDSFHKKYGDLSVHFVGLHDLIMNVQQIA